jgi:hypothetical protein
MCRNIRCLHNFEPPTTDDEVREAALTNAAPKSRKAEAIKGRARHEKRMEREVRIRTAS